MKKLLKCTKDVNFKLREFNLLFSTMIFRYSMSKTCFLIAEYFHLRFQEVKRIV